MKGAIYMISKNCLNNIHQVWGFHNRATAPVKGIWGRTGEFLAGSARAFLNLEYR